MCYDGVFSREPIETLKCLKKGVEKMSFFNVLILSAGRRVELVQCFRSAAKRLGIQSVLVAADCQDTAPALYFADKAVMLPRISSPNYIDSIIDVCNQYGIRIIIPTIDTDLLLLAENKERIESATSARVLVSSKEVIEVCRDKVKTQQFLEREGFQVPRMYSEKELDTLSLNFPLFIKPRDGSSSINAFKVNNRDELDAYRSLIANPLVQDFINGDEYTVDAFLDFDGNVISVVPRLRIATRGGEILKGRIAKDQEIIADVKKMLSRLKPIGHITIQCMKTEGTIKFIEINPRFGGGAPMSIFSGADSCEALYRLLRGEQLCYHENYKDGLLFLRFDNSICLNDKMEMVAAVGDDND